MKASINTSGRLPKLAFTIRNLSSERLRVEYQVEWRDADGAPLPLSNGWLQTQLSGNTEKAVLSIGKSVDAKSASITIRQQVPTEIFVPQPDPQEQMMLQRQYQQQLMQQGIQQ